jgi:hypothetical protein
MNIHLFLYKTKQFSEAFVILSTQKILHIISHLTGNTLHLLKKDQPANHVQDKKKIAYCENHRKHTNTLCGLNAEF